MPSSPKRANLQQDACLQEAEGVICSLQCSALVPGIPAAKARAPLLAAVHLEWRKHMSGLGGGPGISNKHLVEVPFALLLLCMRSPSHMHIARSLWHTYVRKLCKLRL